jgi:hypothetical protein
MNGINYYNLRRITQSYDGMLVSSSAHEEMVDNDMSLEGVNENYADNSSEDSDENHKEIDYPSSESNLSDESDTEKNWHDSSEELSAVSMDNNNNDNTWDEIVTQPSSHTGPTATWSDEETNISSCSVCYQQLVTSPLRIDQLDQHIYLTIPQNRVYLNPCLKHYICGGCIRQSLLSSTNSVLMGGNGHFPCLGDTNCTNALHQRTTTFLYQLRDFFTDSEWSTIMQVSQNLRLGNHFQTIIHHPYLTPLRNKDDVLFEHVYQHMVDIMNHEQPLVKCPICNIYLQKTTECNAMKHSCDWEVCYQCGLIERRLDQNHWKKCPRYNHDPFWRDRGYHCEEGKCYDEHKVCSSISHKGGLDVMHRIMKSYKVYRFLVSLSVSFQKQLVEKLKADHLYDDFTKYIELYSQNKYK